MMLTTYQVNEFCIFYLEDVRLYTMECASSPLHKLQITILELTLLLLTIMAINNIVIQKTRSCLQNLKNNLNSDSFFLYKY